MVKTVALLLMIIISPAVYGQDTAVPRQTPENSASAVLRPGPAGFESAADLSALVKSVVMIRCVSQGFDPATPWKKLSMSGSAGSGLIIADERILTNAHNVSDAQYIEVIKQDQAKRYVARVDFIGHDCDLAILAVEDKSFFTDTTPLELGGIPRVNTTVSTYGYPIGGNQVSTTEGVVSRIQMDIYSHTGADSHLVVQTDAAINPGNSGGPVVQDGKVVGVAFQGLRQAENIGYMIPTTVIRHFLTDIADGKYDGFGSLGFSFFPGLHNAAYQEYLQVPADEQGIVVVRTLLNSSVEKLLQNGDVITRVDDYDIDNDGMVRIYGLRLHLAEVIETKQIGQPIVLTYYRQGKKNQVTAEILLNRTVMEYARLYDKPPDFVVFAGLTFVPLTRNFLETWGPQWPMDIPYYLRYLFNFSSQIHQDPQRQEYVVLSEILPDEVNSYCNAFQGQPMESINGSPVWSLADVQRAFSQSAADFYVVKFMGQSQPMILDGKKARTRQQEILRQYQILADSRLENQQ